MDTLPDVQRAVVGCTRCPRLVEHREAVARASRRMYADWEYWGRPLPSFGDPGARLLIVGLAPAAHGGNRTGRSSPAPQRGLPVRDPARVGVRQLPDFPQPRRRHGAQRRVRHRGWALRSAGQQAAPRRARQLPPIPDRRAVAAASGAGRHGPGKIAFDGVLSAYRETGAALPKPRPQFGHGVAYELAGVTLMAAYHPSRQNTQTGGSPNRCSRTPSAGQRKRSARRRRRW